MTGPLAVSLMTAAGTWHPVLPIGVMPSVATRVGLPKASFGRTTHRTPYGAPWVDQPSAARVASATGTLELRIGGQTPTAAGHHADRWQRVVEGLHGGGRVYVGARYLSVVSVPERPEPVPGAAWLEWTLSVELEYLDDLWRLGPDDLRPRRYPVEALAGIYPLGMLRVVGEGEGYYDVEALDGVTINDTPPVTYAHPDATFTYSHLIEVSDDEPVPN